MQKFLNDNKELVIIIIISFIIGGFLYYSHYRRQDLSYGHTNLNNPIQIGEDKCISYDQAGNFIGQKKCIYGKVINVYTSKKGTTFFDFCQDYKNCPFSAVIFKSDAAKFSNLEKYQGRIIEVTGLVKTYQGRPEIIINEPEQIKIK